MNLRSAQNSLPRATAAAIERSSRHAAAVSFLVLLLISEFGSAHAAQMRFGPYTNAIGATVVTNTDIVLRAVGDMGVDANGNVTGAIGLPVRVHLGADGMATNSLSQQNYFVTNALPYPPFFAGGYLFRAPLDSGPTVYSTTAPGMLIPGKNYFVTQIITNGSLASLTFNILTNVLGYTPLAPADTNGYIRSLQATNISLAAIPVTFWSPSASLWISNLISIGALTTNRYAAGTLLSSTTNSAGLVTFTAASQTNGFTSIVASNALTFMQTNLLPVLTNGFVRSDITNSSATIAYARSLTNGFVDLRITNNAATVQQLISATNGISAGGISAATATNISAAQVALATNGYSSIVFTNAAQVLMTNRLPALTNGFVDSSITNNSATKAYAQSLTNGFVDKNITNNAATVQQLNTKANTNNPTLWTPVSIGGGSTNSFLTNATAYSLYATNNIFLGAPPSFVTDGIGEFQPGSMQGAIFGGSGGLTLAQKVGGNWAFTHGILMGDGSLTNRTGGDSTFTRSIVIGSKLFMDNPDTGANGDVNFDQVLAMGRNLNFYFTNTATEQNITRTFMFGSNITAIAQGGGAADSDSFLIGRNITQRTNQVFQAFYLNGYDLFGGAVNVGTLLNTPGLIVTNGAYTNVLAPSGAFFRSNSSAPFDWFSLSTNGLFSIGTNNVTNFSVSSSGLALMRTASFASYAAQSGKSNMVFIDNLGFVRTNDLSSFVAAIVAGTAGGVPPLTNAYATNFPNGLVTGQRLYFPTNDLAGASNALATANSTASNFVATANSTSSNLLSANKLNKTNDTVYGLTITNTALEGNVAFGFTGQATNIISTTNVVAFFNAGTSLATNGAFIWNSTLGCYTNWITAATLTNNSTAWLMQTNGTSLYSLAGASPFGVYSAVGGTGTPTGVPSFVFNHNGMVDVGWFSQTNFSVMSNNIIVSASNNAVANLNGFSTNQTLTNATLAWTDAPFINFATRGGTINFAAMSAGLANTNLSSGYGAAILSGATNYLSNDGAALIIGGSYNRIDGFSGNSDTIVGGVYNHISASIGTGSTTANVISGGSSNTINLGTSFSFMGSGLRNTLTGNYAEIIGGLANTNISDGGIILGGYSNYVGGFSAIGSGRNVRSTNSDTFVWSDGSFTPATTNAQFNVNATNGLYVNGPLWLNALSTNGGIYILSNRFSLYAVTNTMPNFCHWIGTSNGITVDIYYSNGVSFMKNNWP